MKQRINARSVSRFITGKYFIFVLCAVVFALFAALAPTNLLLAKYPQHIGQRLADRHQRAAV